MKKVNYLLTLLMAAIVLSSCGGLNKMKETANLIKYTVTPDPLEDHADVVALDIKGDFPAKFFNKKALVTATPVLVFDGGETAFDPKTLQGESVQENNDVINFENGGSFSYSSTIPYSDGMQLSDLEIRLVGKIKETSVPFDPVKIAEGVIITPKLVAMNPKSLIMKDKFVRINPDSYGADIHYVINRSEVRNAEISEEDIVKLKDYIMEIQEMENLKFTGIEISAFASPDGELDFNEELSEKRKETAERYLNKEFERAEVDLDAIKNIYSLKSTAEDWEGFKELMEKSDVEDKDLILRVLSMYSDPVVREKEIKNISAAYEVIADDILPKLRRSMLKINIDVIGFSDEEILEFVDSNPDTLNLEEVLYAGKLVDQEDFDKLLEVYQLAVEKNPNCVRAHNNVGWAYVHLNNLSAAKTSFEKAKELYDNDITTNNLGVVALLENDLETAEELFTASMGAGEDVNYNLGIIKIIQADYQTAINNFGNSNSVNAALAKLCNKEPQAAITTLRNIEDKCPKAFYLLAICGARTNDTDMLFNNLRSACSNSPDLKEYAKTDMEFGKYFEDDTFKSIVQ